MVKDEVPEFNPLGRVKGDLVVYNTELDNENGDIPTKYAFDDDKENLSAKEMSVENLPSDKAST